MELIIDGTCFSTLPEFFAEMERLLTRDLTWQTGRNLDAFHDLLRGGFGVYAYGERVTFRWLHADKSRQDLGYDETQRYWLDRAQKCHPSNRERMLQKAEAAKNHRGPTLFDLIAADIQDKESAHTLILEA